MVIKIDLLDRKILYELDIDSRQPITMLAKKLKKDRNVIEYRIKKLQEDGVIKNFVTLLDAGKLGLTVWNVYIEFQNLTPEVERKIINYLKKTKNIWWVAQTAGKWNLVYSIFVKNIKEFYETVRAFNDKFGVYVLSQSLAAHVEVEIFSRGYFLDKPAIGITWHKETEKVKLDKIDNKILKELATNARISSVELATKINSTARIVAYRIKELQKKGIITRFRLQLDVDRIGYSFYKIMVHLKNFSEDNDKKLQDYCKNLGNIFHFERKIGPWMLELEMDIEGYEKANKLMKTMKEKFPDYIKSYDLLLITDEPKGELNLAQML